MLALTYICINLLVLWLVNNEKFMNLLNKHRNNIIVSLLNKYIMVVSASAKSTIMVAIFVLFESLYCSHLVLQTVMNDYDNFINLYLAYKNL